MLAAILEIEYAGLFLLIKEDLSDYRNQRGIGSLNRTR